MARCPTIRSIACTDMHTQHSAYRGCKQLLIILHTLGNTSICLQDWTFYFIWQFICPNRHPHPLLALTFDCLLVICSAPLRSFSQNLYLLSLSHVYSFLIPTSLLSFLWEPDTASISTHLSPTPKELTSPPLPFIPDSVLVWFLLFPPFTFVPSYSKARLTFTHSQ